jgi:hypothetical protein
MRSQLCALCYDERAKHTYWDRGEACRACGPTKAECLLAIGHSGDHEGNGFDDVGPMPRIWSERRRVKKRGRHNFERTIVLRSDHACRGAICCECPSSLRVDGIVT